MDVRMLGAGDATYTLGELGMPEAFDALLAETNVSDDTNAATKAISNSRRLGGAIGLARLHRRPGDTDRIRTAMQGVYEKADKQTRMQILRAMQHLMDPGVQPFLLNIAKSPEEELPDLRVIALNAFSMFANAAEAAQARAVIAAEPGADDGGFKTLFTEQNDKALTVAAECNEDVACYVRKLGDRDGAVAQKAAYMLARYGQNNAAAITALIAQVGSSDAKVRGDVLYALDHCADTGSAAAVTRIEELQRAEEGRAIWNQVKTLALATASRLRHRAGAAR
jgi:hypothetical protein